MANSFEVQLKGEREGFKGSEIEVSFARGGKYIVGPGQGKDGKAVVEISFDKSGQKKVKLYNKGGALDEFGFEGKDYAEFNADTIETFPDSSMSIKIAGAGGKISTVTVRGTDIVINDKKPDRLQILFDEPLNVKLSENYFKDISEGKIEARAFPPQIFDAIKGLNGVSAQEFTIKGETVRLFAIGKEGEAQIYCGVSNKFIKLEEIFDLGAGKGYHILGFRFRGGKNGNVGDKTARIDGVTTQEIEELLNFIEAQAGEKFIRKFSPGAQVENASLNFNQNQTSQKIVDPTKEDKEILRLRKELEQSEQQAEDSKKQAEDALEREKQQNGKEIKQNRRPQKKLPKTKRRSLAFKKE